MNNILRLLTSKTVLGSVGMVGTWLASLPVIDWKHVLGGASAVLATAGVRDALHQVTDAVNKP
jgi:hypothetical protein